MSIEFGLDIAAQLVRYFRQDEPVVNDAQFSRSQGVIRLRRRHFNSMRFNSFNKLRNRENALSLVVQKSWHSVSEVVRVHRIDGRYLSVYFIHFQRQQFGLSLAVLLVLGCGLAFNEQQLSIGLGAIADEFRSLLLLVVSVIVFRIWLFSVWWIYLALLKLSFLRFSCYKIILLFLQRVSPPAGRPVKVMLIP